MTTALGVATAAVAAVDVATNVAGTARLAAGPQVGTDTCYGLVGR